MAKFSRTFWISNFIELFERWAWYGMFMILALYLTGSQESGALGFSQSQKGILMGGVVGILYFLPIFTGAIADKFGYKRVLLIALSIMASGYFMLGFVKSYSIFFLVFLYLAIGASLFKPIISATISKTTNISTASVGFGIFYMMVNIGSFLGPIFSSKLSTMGWHYVFIMAASLSFFNLAVIFFFYKNPDSAKTTQKQSLWNILSEIANNLVSIVSEFKLIIFLILIVGFWTIYNQLFYALPVFIDQWINTTPLYDALHQWFPTLANSIDGGHHTIKAEMITNIDAGFIILFQIFISSFIKRYKAIHTILIGILIATIGISLSYLTQNIFYLIISIFIFSIGEMTGSPKITEYIGHIAPKGKTALYMGSSFLPLSLGNLFAGIISGSYYESTADKYSFVRQKLLDIGIPNFKIKTLSNNDALQLLQTRLHLSKQELTDYLWNTYHPYNYWILLFAIGILTVFGLLIYSRWVANDNKTGN